MGHAAAVRGRGDLHRHGARPLRGPSRRGEPRVRDSTPSTWSGLADVVAETAGPGPLGGRSPCTAPGCWPSRMRRARWSWCRPRTAPRPSRPPATASTPSSTGRRSGSARPGREGPTGARASTPATPPVPAWHAVTPHRLVERHRDVIPVAEAQAVVLTACAPLAACPVALDEAPRLGDLAEAVVAVEDSPPFANSGDGRLRACGPPTRAAARSRWPSSGRDARRAAPRRPVGAGEAVRIMTGAPMPARCRRRRAWSSGPTPTTATPPWSSSPRSPAGTACAAPRRRHRGR